MIETIDSGTHTAVVDAVAGAGVLLSAARPFSESDVVVMSGPRSGSLGLPSVPVSLYASGWTAMVVKLYEAGWAFLEDEEGDIQRLATTSSGGVAYALWPAALDLTDMSDEELEPVCAEWQRCVRALLEHAGKDWTLVD